MHIAYLIPTIDRIGGAESQLMQLAGGMANRGWNITIIALSGTGSRPSEELARSGVSFLSLEMRHGLLDPGGWMRLHRWLGAHNPEVVHAHLPHAALMARWSRLAAPYRVLIDTIHTPATGAPARRLGYRLSAWLPDVVTAVSAAAAEPWLNARMVDSSSLEIIFNGIDFDHWNRDPCAREKARRQSGFVGEFVWIAVGRLDPVKDHATLLHAFARLPVHSRLLLAGTGPLEPMLRRISRELGIRSRVAFLGFQNDVLYWMRQADAFVLNSRWEGLPVALIEACACELPAVISNTPGAREILPDSPIDPVPVGDPDALAVAMKAVMSLPDGERRNCGLRERQSLMTRFNLNTMLDSYEVLYRNALAMHSRPTRWRTSSSLSPALLGSSTTGK